MYKIDDRLMDIYDGRDIDKIVKRIKYREKKEKWKYMPEIVISYGLLLAFALGWIFKGPSKLEQEIEEHGKAAMEYLTKEDTDNAIYEIRQGMDLMKEKQVYSSAKKFYEIINRIEDNISN